MVALLATLRVGCAVGLTGRDATDIGPVPRAFFAATLKVYDVPFVNPLMSCTTCRIVVERRAGCAVAPMNGVTT
jgi:hypothetical protein